MKYENLTQKEKDQLHKQFAETAKVQELFDIIDSFTDEENEDKLSKVLHSVHLYIDYTMVSRVYSVYAPGDICFVVMREWLEDGDEEYTYLGKMKPFPEITLDNALSLIKKVHTKIFKN